MTKIFIRKVHEDSGWRISFGDKDDVKDWKEQEKDWEEQGLSCGDDSIEEIGDTDNLSELLTRINEEIRDD